jgi:6-phosphogluconolactonase (cycloisomerase 2 family)
VLSASVSLNGQTAPCWLIATPNGRYAYTGNAGTGTIGSYAIGADGTLTLITGAAAALGASALDLGITRDGDFLYVREAVGSNAGAPGDITGFHVEADGSLTRVNTVVGLPPGAQGIAVQ